MPGKKNRVQQDIYIEWYRGCRGNKSEACRQAKIHPRTMNKWFEEPEFAARAQAALDSLVEEAAKKADTWVEDLERVSRERAKEKSDTLAIFHLKAAKPEMYDDNIRKLKYAKEHGIDDPEKPQRVVVQLISDPTPQDVPPEPDVK